MQSIGTPSIRTNKWDDDVRVMSVVSYMEDMYGLGISISSQKPDEVIQKVKDYSQAGVSHSAEVVQIPDCKRSYYSFHSGCSSQKVQGRFIAGISLCSAFLLCLCSIIVYWFAIYVGANRFIHPEILLHKPGSFNSETNYP